MYHGLCGFQGQVQNISSFWHEVTTSIRAWKNIYVLSKPTAGKKAEFCSPYISASQILPSMVAKFDGKKPSKEWELCIMAAQEAWALA